MLKCKKCGVFLIPEWDGGEDAKATRCGYCATGKPEGYQGREKDGSRPILRIPEDFEPLKEDYPDAFDADGNLDPEAWEVDWEHVYNEIEVLMNTLDPYNSCYIWIKTMGNSFIKSRTFYQSGKTRDWVLDMFERGQSPDDWTIWFCGDHIEFRYASAVVKIYPSRWLAYSNDRGEFITGRRFRGQDTETITEKATLPAVWVHPDDAETDVGVYLPNEDIDVRFAYDDSIYCVDCFL